jgi:hypothetical protein
MSTAANTRRLPRKSEWLLFAVQLFVLWSLESLEDVVRGNFAAPNPTTAIENARALARFESAHYLYIEPQIQSYFRSGGHLIGDFPSWGFVVQFANNVYAWLHILVPLAVLAWLFAYHRRRFALVRNLLFLANVLALVGYFIYPLAPPRLTTGLTFHGHPFHFWDTMPHTVIHTQLNGRPLGFSPYAAMPSIHIAWAVIMAGSLILFSRNLPLRLLASLYPLLILFSIVVTANHYVMDGVGAVLDVLVAAGLALVLERMWNAIRRDRDRRTSRT